MPLSGRIHHGALKALFKRARLLCPGGVNEDIAKRQPVYDLTTVSSNLKNGKEVGVYPTVLWRCSNRFESAVTIPCSMTDFPPFTPSIAWVTRAIAASTEMSGRYP